MYPAEGSEVHVSLASDASDTTGDENRHGEGEIRRVRGHTQVAGRDGSDMTLVPEEDLPIGDLSG